MTTLTAKQIADSMARHAAIVGTVGSGKTFTAKGIVEELIAAGRRVCVLDPTGAWWGLKSSADGKKAGLPFAIFGGDHADVPINEHSGEAVAKVIASQNLPAIIDLSQMMVGERQRFMLDFAQHLFILNKTPLHLVIDEADEFAPQNPIADQKRMLHHVDRLVRRGRSRGFRIILISQRPAVLHKNVLTQIATLVAMKLTSPQDRKALQAWVEGNADEGEAAKVMKSLASLPIGEGWVWAPGAGILARHKFPRIKTFDSSRTPDDDETIAEPTKLADVDVSEIKATFEAAKEDEPTKGGGISEAEVRRRIGIARDQVLAEAKANMIPKSTAANELGAILEVVERSFATSRAAIERVIAEFSKIETGRKFGPVDALSPNISRDISKRRRAINAETAEAKADPATPFYEYDPSAISQGDRTILTALAQSGGYLDRTNLSLLTGYKKTTRDLYIRRLIALGHAERDEAGNVIITDAGKTALGTFERLPEGVALRDYWLGKLPDGEANILRHVWGNDLTRDQVSDKTGYKKTTRDLYLRRLAARKLITYTDRGRVHAASALYD